MTSAQSRQERTRILDERQGVRHDAGADGDAEEHVSDEEDHLWVRRGNGINQTMFLSLDPLLLSARSCKCAHEIALLSLEPTTLLVTSCRLLAFVVILALANLGTSFAYAILAKDTKTANGELVDINTNEVVATGQAAQVYTVGACDGENARKL